MIADRRVITLRLEPDIHSWLREQAHRNYRTMTGEIIARLEQTKQHEEFPVRTASADAAGK